MIELALAQSPVSEIADFERLTPLDAGQPVESMRERLAQLTPAEIVAPHPLVDTDMAMGCLAGLWLHYNFLTEAHCISQELQTREGHYWHGLMHRRGPDAALHAAHWMRQVGEHPIHLPLAAFARDLVIAGGVDSRADFLAVRDHWSAISFIDLCETYSNTRSSTERLCQQIQRFEWCLLFEDCWKKAIGAG